MDVKATHSDIAAVRIEIEGNRTEIVKTDAGSRI